MPGTIVPLPVILEEDDRKIYEKLQPPATMVVRYGYTRMIAELPYKGDAKPGCGTKLVIRTPRGTELAEMLTSTCPNAGCGSSVTRKEMLEFIENSGGKDYPFNEKGRILRVATIDDINQRSHLDGDKTELLKFARQAVSELDLPMKIVEVEQLLGGERIIFHYTSDQWVDFRELVKRLAGEYRTRIEMHQVNAREEARLVADYERCGQHCCCKQFLKVLKPVSMRSAKVQKATLDPTKISGRCGRLMCCLRYEDETYETLRKRLPHKQTLVRCEDGEGVVIDSQILTQLVLVRLEETGKIAAYPLENLEILGKADARKQARDKKPRDGERGRGQEARDGGNGRNNGGRGERKDQRRDTGPQRPQPGKPLADKDVESREGDASAAVPQPETSGGYSNPKGQGPPPAPPSPPPRQPDTPTPDDTPADASGGEQTDQPDTERAGDATAGEQGGDEQKQGKRRRRRRRGGRRRRRGGGGGGSGGGGGGGGGGGSGGGGGGG